MSAGGRTSRSAGGGVGWPGFAAVAEAGVIGKPDPVALEVVKAFVALRAGYEPSDALKKDIMAHARKRLGVFFGASGEQAILRSSSQ